MAIKSIKSGAVADGAVGIAARLRTAKEVTQVLEELRKAYQSLTSAEKREVRSFMVDLFESQRRFGSLSPYRSIEVWRTSSGG